ncbi:MAG: hypothetical protein AAF380_01655 [Bacteroidota bacterium]
MMKKTILLSLLAISAKASSLKACSDQNISFLQANGSLQARIQATYQDTSTHKPHNVHYTKPVILHPEFSVEQFLHIPARLQKNYYHEEAHYIYLGARGLKGGMKLQDKIDELLEVALSYARTNSHDVPEDYRPLIAKKAMAQALAKYSWHYRAFWLDTEKQKQIKEKIKQNIRKLKKEYFEERKKANNEGDNFRALTRLQDELETWENRFHKDGEAMKKDKRRFAANIVGDRGKIVGYLVSNVTAPIVQPYIKKGLKKGYKKGKKLVLPKAKKKTTKKLNKGKKTTKDDLYEQLGQSVSGYTGSKFGSKVAQEFECKKDSAGDFACRGAGTFVGRNVHGVVKNGFEKTFTQKALGTNALASAGGIGGEWLGEKLGGAIGEDCGNEELGEAIGGAVGSIAAQTFVATVCLIM